MHHNILKRRGPLRVTSRNPVTGDYSKQDQTLLVKIGKYIVFRVYRQSLFTTPPPRNSALVSQREATDRYIYMQHQQQHQHQQPQAYGYSKAQNFFEVHQALTLHYRSSCCCYCSHINSSPRCRLSKLNSGVGYCCRDATYPLIRVRRAGYYLSMIL